MSCTDNSDDLCIFCLELLNKKSNKENKKNNITNITNEMQDIAYTNLKLKCNHVFHIECFFLYIKYHYKKPDGRIGKNKLKCPVCRYIILKNNIRKILIKYLFLLRRLRLKISIRKIFIYFNDNTDTIDTTDTTHNTDTLELEKSYSKDEDKDEEEQDKDEEDEDFLKNKLEFRSRQILKLVLI